MKPKLVLTGRRTPHVILDAAIGIFGTHPYDRALQYRDGDRLLFPFWFQGICYEYRVQYQTEASK